MPDSALELATVSDETDPWGNRPQRCKQDALVRNVPGVLVARGEGISEPQRGGIAASLERAVSRPLGMRLHTTGTHMRVVCQGKPGVSLCWSVRALGCVVGMGNRSQVLNGYVRIGPRSPNVLGSWETGRLAEVSLSHLHFGKSSWRLSRDPAGEGRTRGRGTEKAALAEAPVFLLTNTRTRDGLWQ